MLQEPEFHRVKKRGDLMITWKPNVHTSIHKVYKEKWLYRLLKAKITSISTYSQPYIHKNPSYRPIPTQNSSYPANPTTSGNAGHELIELWAVPEFLEVSELQETNLSSRSRSPSLRALWRRHFFMELKTSGSSMSSDSSDCTYHTSL